MSNDDQRAEALDAEEQETRANKLQTEFHADVLAGLCGRGPMRCECAECQEKRDRTRYNPNQITMGM